MEKYYFILAIFFTVVAVYSLGVLTLSIVYSNWCKDNSLRWLSWLGFLLLKTMSGPQ
jgi:hypothetical protein